MWLPLLLVSFVLCQDLASAADTCQTCVAAGHSWCVESSKCQPLTCKTSIKNALNCPTAPQTGYEYTDDFGRNVALPIIVAAGIHDPMTCLKNAIPTSALDKIVDAPCAYLGPNVSCHAYTAYDTVQKLIIVSFRGTDGSTQLFEEFESFLEHKEPFFDSGHVYKYFYDAFMLLWHQGLESSVRNLKYLYPNYDVWVMGHSLGGALASVCSSYMLKVGLATPDHLRLVTFGQPRTGDKDWAQWHDSTFLYSYRIVHHKDIVPHIPPRGGPDEVWHHRFEIWYNNPMAVGDPYQICAEDDGLYCSNTQADLSTADHGDYFRPNMYGWASRVDALRLLLVFSSFAGLSFSFVEKRSVLSGSRDDKEQGHRLGIGIGLGLFALLVVVFTAYLGIRRINSKDEAPTAKPTLWRRRRERRIRRHLNNRLKREQESRSTTTDGDEQTRHLASRYANPKNYIKRRTNKKEAKVVQFFRHHRMKRCARRAAARERARVRVHSRAHDRKLRALGKTSKPSYNVPCQPAEGDDTRLDVDGQRRLKSKFSSEKHFPHETPIEYWKEKMPVPPKRKSKEHARLKSKEIVVQEEKPESKTKLFIPNQKKLNSLAKKMQPDAEDKALIEDKNGVDFNWPISLEMMYEQLPETDFSKANKLEEMITGWAEAGVFNMEEQVREKRSMGPLWDHAAMTPQKATTSPNRVRLNPSKWLHQNDWINASYLGPPEDSQRFICSPAPDKSWEYEYWTMLVDHNVRCIVQLNNWDYHTPVMDQKQFFIPFERQHYVSSQSKASHMSNEKNNSGGEKDPKVKSAESTVSQIDECIKLRKEYKLGRGRKKDGRNPRRRLSVKRKPVDDPNPQGGKTKKKKGKGRQKGGREVSKIIKTSTEKSDSKSTTDPINRMTKPTSTETRPTSKETLTNKETKSTNKDTKSTNRETNTPSAKQDNESRSIYSKDKDMPTSPPVAPATPAERRKARKLRRKLRRGMRRIREDGGIPEILIRKLSACYLFPEPATQDENSDVQFSVKPCRHPNRVNYWRIVNGNNADEEFWVRATLLRVVCRQKDVNYKMVHFQVFNLDPYQPPDFTRYKCLINLVNKIAGTVSVVSEHGLSRAPTFCLSAILLQQLKADQLPDLLKLYSQMQLDRPGCFFRPHGFFIALRTMLEHVKQYQKHFKQKDSLEKLLTEIKLTFCLKRF